MKFKFETSPKNENLGDKIKRAVEMGALDVNALVAIEREVDLPRGLSSKICENILNFKNLRTEDYFTVAKKMAELDGRALAYNLEKFNLSGEQQLEIAKIVAGKLGGSNILMIFRQKFDKVSDGDFNAIPKKK